MKYIKLLTFIFGFSFKVAYSQYENIKIAYFPVGQEITPHVCTEDVFWKNDFLMRITEAKLNKDNYEYKDIINDICKFPAMNTQYNDIRISCILKYNDNADTISILNYGNILIKGKQYEKNNKFILKIVGYLPCYLESIVLTNFKING